MRWFDVNAMIYMKQDNSCLFSHTKQDNSYLVSHMKQDNSCFSHIRNRITLAFSHVWNKITLGLSHALLFASLFFFIGLFPFTINNSVIFLYVLFFFIHFPFRILVGILVVILQFEKWNKFWCGSKFVNIEHLSLSRPSLLDHSSSCLECFCQYHHHQNWYSSSRFSFCLLVLFFFFFFQFMLREILFCSHECKLQMC